MKIIKESGVDQTSLLNYCYNFSALNFRDWISGDKDRTLATMEVSKQMREFIYYMKKRVDADIAGEDIAKKLEDYSSYVPGCMQQRNRYMVDHCDLLLAVHDGVSGGTQSTLTYAFSHQINVVILPLVVEKVDTPCYNTPQTDIKEYTEL